LLRDKKREDLWHVRGGGLLQQPQKLETSLVGRSDLEALDETVDQILLRPTPLLDLPTRAWFRTRR
jgi:hypothetical protein